MSFNLLQVLLANFSIGIMNHGSTSINWITIGLDNWIKCNLDEVFFWWIKYEYIKRKRIYVFPIASLDELIIVQVL